MLRSRSAISGSAPARAPGRRRGRCWPRPRRRRRPGAGRSWPPGSCRRGASRRRRRSSCRCASAGRHGGEPRARAPETWRPARRVAAVECFEVTGGAALTGRVRVTGREEQRAEAHGGRAARPGPTDHRRGPRHPRRRDHERGAPPAGLRRHLRAHGRRRRWRPGGHRRAREALDRDRLRPGPQDACLDQRPRPAGRALRLRQGGTARRRRHRLARPRHAHLRPGAARRDDRQRARLPRRHGAPADRHRRSGWTSRRSARPRTC